MSQLDTVAFSHSRYIKVLRDLIAGESKPVDTLIIAHDDYAMIKAIVDAMPDGLIAVLPIRQAEWEGNLKEVIACAIDSQINDILIAGHSSGLEILSPELLRKESQNFGRETSLPNYNRLLSGACKTGLANRKSRQHFADQISQLVDCHELGEQMCNDDFRLQAIFYVKNSGVFLLHDFRDGVFAPIWKQN
ncbi:hypothetical protein CA54_27280 [Symmachiella macrocystis]|uniref:Uncharacterized protein n=1 Tax=Symmachiella macrocystis TaxID=2527985 RepID=A0A5C6BQ74_9PLAN|nr:hypothetical protein [Symmachiella macrocystis]TWU13887.1 hypothetical protein CA54_27280 [Symmachiella macrocystis]